MEGETGGGDFNRVVIRENERRGMFMKKTKIKRARERGRDRGGKNRERKRKERESKI